MLVQGIVAEYNPLHNGHLYHMQQSKLETGATHTVVVLSSQFVQRGEPAFVDKWARTEMALAAGADLVLELPVAFSCGSAEYFASAAVSILNAANIIDVLSFGSESGTLADLDQAAVELVDESEHFKHVLKAELKRGVSYPRARIIALKETGVFTDGAAMPNNILGIEYIKALKRTGSGIRAFTLERKGQGYHSPQMENGFASATAIRKAWWQSPASTLIGAQLPDFTQQILTRIVSEGRGPIRSDAFSDMLLYHLRTMSPAQLRSYPYCSDGLAERIFSFARGVDHLDTLINAANSPRHPSSRIRRILSVIAIGLSDQLLQNLSASGYAPYLRVLGFRNSGKDLLALMKKRATLPILTKPAAYKKLENPLGKQLFELEITATSIYALAMSNPTNRIDFRELKQNPVMFSGVTPSDKIEQK